MSQCTCTEVKWLAMAMAIHAQWQRQEGVGGRGPNLTTSTSGLALSDSSGEGCLHWSGFSREREPTGYIKLYCEALTHTIWSLSSPTNGCVSAGGPGDGVLAHTQRPENWENQWCESWSKSEGHRPRRCDVPAPAERVNSPSSACLLFSGLQEIGWCLPALGRAISLLSPMIRC